MESNLNLGRRKQRTTTKLKVIRLINGILCFVNEFDKLTGAEEV